VEQRALIDGLSRGDARAFADLLAQFQDRVVNLCHRFLRDQDEAEDTAQEVFLEVWRSIGRFRRDAKLSTWIYRIAANKAIDALRRGKRRREHSGDPEAVLAQAASPEAAGPERQWERKEREALLHRALAALPEAQRTALHLHKLEGLGLGEAAEVMGLTAGAFQSLVFRGRRALEQLLQDEIRREGRAPRGAKERDHEDERRTRDPAPCLPDPR